MDSDKGHNFLLQWALVDCLVAEWADRVTGNSHFQDAKFPPGKEKNPDNPRKMLVLPIYYAVTLTPFIGINYNDMVSLQNMCTATRRGKIS